jgi:uncharacterized protein (TIGR03435 family)
MRLREGLAHGLALTLCLCFGDGSDVLLAQRGEAPAAKLEFEVASVKPNNSGDRRSSMQWQPGGRFVAVNLPLLSLVSIGYQVPLYQIEGLPNWVTTTRFDINAKADREPALDERPALLRALLEDRFQVVRRTENRDMPIYAMVLARSDGRLGPGLRPSAVDCDAVNAARVVGQGPVITPGTRPTCAAILGVGSITAGAVPLSTLTGMLSAQLKRMIIDRTGLSGRFDMDLSSSGTDTPAAAPGTAPGTAERPSLFTALQEQLGLKLEPQRGPSPVTIFERIEMPTED